MIRTTQLKTSIKWSQFALVISATLGVLGSGCGKEVHLEAMSTEINPSVPAASPPKNSKIPTTPELPTGTDSPPEPGTPVETVATCSEELKIYWTFQLGREPHDDNSFNRFQLCSNSKMISKSITATVNGVAVPFDFNPESKLIHIQPVGSENCRERVEVSACRAE